MCGWSPKKYLHLYLGKCKGKGKVHVMDGLNGMQSRYQAIISQNIRLVKSLTKMVTGYLRTTKVAICVVYN